jgi:hypothetical protein
MYILFYEDIHALIVRQIMFGIMIDHVFTTSFIWVILFYEAFKYGDGAKFWSCIGTNTE